MKTLDLFSGIGGFHLALRPFGFETTAFCDIDERSRTVLRARMDDGNIPNVPIHEDVRSVTLGPGDVDMIVGGFPCVDFSKMGPREGIQLRREMEPGQRTEGLSRSALVHELIRLTNEGRPSFVFMENVANIVNYTAFDEIMNSFRDMNYVVRWSDTRASDFGAPHQRHRWWCLAVRRDTPFHVLETKHGVVGGVHMFDWSKDREPERTGPTDDRARNFLLGNSLVPCVAMRMFINLWTANNDVSIASNRRSWSLDRTTDGYISLTKETHPPRNIVLDPHAYQSPVPPGPKLRLPILVEPKPMTHWATPRANSFGPSNYLTTRSTRDLSTQVRFEVDTLTDRGARLSGNFVEFLMGYPDGWTSVL